MTSNKSWRTRRKRYGKNGIMDTKTETKETYIQISKGTQRRRPNTHYYKGDQIKPLSNSIAGKKQWRRSVVIDIQRPGTKYEVWERVRIKRKGHKSGLDRWANEWAHLKDPAPKSMVKLVKLTK
jgi:hypothetical protein